MTLVAAGLNKHYGPTRAASDVSITLRAGTVHAIVGENGAGKSTTLRMLGGALRPDSGEMTLDGVAYAPQSVVDAATRGVALVHQEITINRSLTIAENIFIGNLRRYARPLGIMKRKMMATVAQAALDVLGKCLAVAPTLLLLNNPTRGVDMGARVEIYGLIRKKAAEGLAILLSSEDMPELIGMSDRLIVLRQGVASREFTSLDNVQEHDIVKYMT